MSTQRMLVLGAGGIGGVIAGRLSGHFDDVTVADQWPEHVEAMRSGGLVVNDREGSAAGPVRAIHLHELQAEADRFDLVFLSVKTYDTEWAAQFARRHVRDDGAVVVCQNGITDSRVAAIVGAERTVGCVVTLAGAAMEPGVVTRNDAYSVGFRVGELDGPVRERTTMIADRLNTVAVTEVTGNLDGERWAKLATNCMVNALSGITGYSAGEVRSRDDTLAVLVHLGAETIQVGRALGHRVEPVMGIDPGRFVDAARGVGRDQLLDEIRIVAKATGTHKASMLQDVIKGRRTEIEDLNGHVVRSGATVDVATPFSQAAVEAVLAFPPGEVVADPRNLERLVRMAEERA
ncbi:MAG TPA: 2-dehydropantoate 2-reductase [Pseudolysinimonas sp.]|nr:2-dehydropantoate 2-reductase [Pseudolysinimonas sp.]